MRRRGYTLREVADLFGLSPGRLSQVAADRERAPHFDWALWGLPAKRVAQAVLMHRRHLVRRVDQRVTGSGSDPWAELLVPGAVFVVLREQGDHLPEGCEGVVRRVRRERGDVRVELAFSTGYREVFLLSFLRQPTSFLFATGRVADT